MGSTRLDELLRRNRMHSFLDVAVSLALVLGLALSATAVAIAIPPTAPRAQRSTAAQTGAAAARAISGRVLDERGRPVGGAVVLARPLYRPAASPLPRSPVHTGDDHGITVTDDNGRFALASLPPGRYVLVALAGRHSPGQSGPVAISDRGFPAALKIVLAGGLLSV